MEYWARSEALALYWGLKKLASNSSYAFLTIIPVFQNSIR